MHGELHNGLDSGLVPLRRPGESRPEPIGDTADLLGRWRHRIKQKARELVFEGALCNLVGPAADWRGRVLHICQCECFSKVEIQIGQVCPCIFETVLGKRRDLRGLDRLDPGSQPRGWLAIVRGQRWRRQREVLGWAALFFGGRLAAADSATAESFGAAVDVLLIWSSSRVLSWPIVRTGMWRPSDSAVL